MQATGKPKTITVAVITILEVDPDAYRAEYGKPEATIAEIREDVKASVFNAGATAAFPSDSNDLIIRNATLKNR